MPIYVGLRGPHVLELAGELADGVIVGNLPSTDGWRYALDHIAKGAERAGRKLNELLLTAWVYFAVADERSDALDAVRPRVATSLLTSRSILHERGIELPPRFAETMEHMDWSLEHETAKNVRVVLAAGGGRDDDDLADEWDCAKQLLQPCAAVGGCARDREARDRFVGHQPTCRLDGSSLEVVPLFATQPAAETR